MAYVVLFLQDNGMSVIIPSSVAKFSQCDGLNPPCSPLTQVVAHLKTFLATLFKCTYLNPFHVLMPFLMISHIFFRTKVYKKGGHFIEASHPLQARSIVGPAFIALFLPSMAATSLSSCSTTTKQMMCGDMISSCCGHVSNFTALLVLINKGGDLLRIHDGLVKFIVGIHIPSG
jgi:hypothetical protein